MSEVQAAMWFLSSGPGA